MHFNCKVATNFSIMLGSDQSREQALLRGWNEHQVVLLALLAAYKTTLQCFFPRLLC